MNTLDNDELDWPQAILHLDMDAFYANVHLLDHPEDAGLPIAIGGKPNQRGVVASASYEARAAGIRSAMPMGKAVRLCPTLKVVPANWPRIKSCSQQVMETLTEYGIVEKISVDEAYVDISGYKRPFQQSAKRPLSLPETIRQHVKTVTGLPASVGLATSKLVAKVASDYDKPEGCTIVPPGQERSFLAPQSVRVIWGIGPRTAERLATMDMLTCGDLAAVNLTLLKQQFKNQAEGLQQRARGIDLRPVNAKRGLAKSISQEWTFSQDSSNPDLLKEKLQRMAESVSHSLTKNGLVAYTVAVKFRWSDFTTFTRQKSVTVSIDSSDTIYQLAEQLWQENWTSGQRMRLLGVRVSGIHQPQTRQLGFEF